MKSRFFTLLLLATLVFLLPPAAQAQSSNNVAEVLGCVASWLYGPLGQVIGVLAVVAVGVTAMFGRIQVSTVLTVMAGLALMLGAQKIVTGLGITLQAGPAACGGADIVQSDVYSMFSCIIAWFMGPMGKGLATLAIIALGIFATYGKISYQQAIVVGAGIAATFGSMTIINSLSVSNTAVSNGACGVGGGSADPLVNAFCSMAAWFKGSLGQGVATLAIITLGIGALYGKVSWPMGLIFGVGTALVFGADAIVTALGVAVTPTGVAIAGCATASSDATFTKLFCSVISWFQGPMGMGLATLGIIAMGVGALYGKISWPTALVVGLGTALVFGGSTIVAALGTASSGAAGCPQAVGDPGALGKLFCNVVGWFSGPMGAGMATLAIVILGVGALYGKVSWPMALIVGAGVALVFGSTSMINALGNIPNGICNSKQGAPEALSTMFCSVISWFNGPLGKGMATLSVIILGFGALYGKISWPMAMIVGLGVAMIFGATTVIESMGGGVLSCTSPATTPSALATLFCNIAGWVNGPLGKGIATLAIVITGFAALSGKITWPSAIIVAVGVSLVFGATSVVTSLGGNGLERCARGELATTKQPGGQITPMPPLTPLPPKNPPVVSPTTKTPPSGTWHPPLSSSGGSIPGTGGYSFGGGTGSISYPDLVTPGTLTINPYGSVMIPAGTNPGDVITVGNGWTLTMPGAGLEGSIRIPENPPLAPRVIPIPAPDASDATDPNAPSPTIPSRQPLLPSGLKGAPVR